MKKNLQKQLVNSTKLFARLCAGILLCFVLQLNQLQAQSCPLACDDEVNVSLDDNCEAVITPDMLLEEVGGNCAYTVVVFGTNGLPLPAPIVNSTHIGKKLKVSIQLGQNSCWGHILVEDKFRPVFECPIPDTVYCSDRNYQIPAGIYYDNCTPEHLLVKHVIYDSMVMFDNCAKRRDSLIGYRKISCYYRDLSGNNSDTCEQYIYFKKFYERDILWPSDKEYTCKEYNDSIPHPNESGVPSVFGDAIYPDYALCKVAIKYEDEIIPICPKSFKVLRAWTVIDWCMPTGENVYKHYQVIKVTDTRGPVLICQPMQTISTDPQSCTGTVIVGPPIIIDECSKVSFQVGYKVQSSNGVPTYEGTSTANVFLLPNGFYRITGLPLGLNWVIFRGTDECGNFTDCATEVLVEDQIPPIPICDQKTIVSLTVDGTARIDAITFDDNSIDNCELDRFEVRRMDNGAPCNTTNGSLFGPSVYFCCADIGKTLMVALRVWDKAGNNNICMVEVMVQDKIAPLVFCPPNITVSCEFGFTDYSVFGNVVDSIKNRKPIVILDSRKTINGPAIDGYAYDGCGVTIREFAFPNLKCGVGTISRTFTATDPTGNSHNCTQVITIQDFTPDNLTITWPKDYTSTTTCISAPNLDPKVTGEVILANVDKCNNIFINYEDKTFVNDPDACLKVIRTWTVIDWCVYDPNAQRPQGEYVWKQIIKISNLVPPTFTSSCLDRTVDVFGPGCAGNLDLVATATDDCTDSTDLLWKFKIDINNDNVADTLYNRSRANASGTYPIGRHKVTYTVTDACGNTSTCMFILTVRDGKKPTPYCIGNIVTTIMPSSKNIAIWAKDFNLNSEDNCTPKDSLYYYFIVNNTKVPGMVFDCANIGMNTVRMYVEDKAGNSDYCEAKIEIQDPNKVCGTATGLTIQGRLTNASNQTMENTSVFLERTSPAGSAITYTDNAGIFSFKAITPGTNYLIRAEKNTNCENGVSTADIVLIQKHILGKATLPTPYKLIAADANNNGSITSADISEIRKLILGINSAYTKNKSWRFVPSAYVFLDPTNPFPFNEQIEYNSISRNEMNTNFVGIKIGDVSEDSNPNNVQSTKTRSNDVISLQVEDQELIKSTVSNVSITLSEALRTSGLQLNLKLNSTLVKFNGIQSKILSLDKESYVVIDNVVKISISPAELMDLKAGTELLSLQLEVLNNGKLSSAISLNKIGMNSEIYDENVNVNSLELNFRHQATTHKAGAKMLQSSPNPFTEETQVKFYLPKSQLVSFEIYDINGAKISKKDNYYTEGNHQLVIRKTQLGNSGIYFVRMNSEEYSETIKVVLIK